MITSPVPAATLLDHPWPRGDATAKDVAQVLERRMLKQDWAKVGPLLAGFSAQARDTVGLFLINHTGPAQERLWSAIEQHREGPILELMQVLVALGADPDSLAATGGGASRGAPLNLVAKLGLVPWVDAFAAAGANLDGANSTGLTAAMVALESGNDAVLYRLHAHGAKLAEHRQPKTSSNLLHLACYYNCPSVLPFLVSQVGIDVNAKNKYGKSSAHISHESVELLRGLHALGADLNAKDAKGQTVAHLAVSYAAAPAFAFLLSQGVDVDHPDDERQETARDLAQDWPELAFMLQSHDAAVAAKRALQECSIAAPSARRTS